jgi:hypothetical protein
MKKKRVVVEIELAAGGRLGALELAAKLNRMAAQVLRGADVRSFKTEDGELGVVSGPEDLAVEPILWRPKSKSKSH